ncbi:MAG: PIN domain-containing protein [Propionicimonas sp.]
MSAPKSSTASTEDQEYVPGHCRVKPTTPWSRTLRSPEVFLPAPCWAELQRGVHLLPQGRRRERITAGLESLVSSLGGIVAFGRVEAEVYAELTSQPGRPRPTIDAMIAAICRTHGLALATRNTRDFDGCGIDLVDPWQ